MARKPRNRHSLPRLPATASRSAEAETPRSVIHLDGATVAALAISAFDASYAWERVEDSRTASTAFPSALPPLTPRAVLKVQGVRFRQTMDHGPRNVEGVVKWFLEMHPLRAARLLKDNAAPAD
jgi:hypothetical protein